MCTAISFKHRLYGRTLDYEEKFGQRILITPRERIFLCETKNRYAMIGIGVLSERSPLYFDAMNEWGLWGAALSFSGSAVYSEPGEGEVNLSPAGLIPFILGLCRSIDEAVGALRNIRISDSIDRTLGSTPLHWIFSDPRRTIAVEPRPGGLSVVENKPSVLTNSPDFSYHTYKLCEHMQHSSGQPKNALCDFELPPYSRGLGAFGLPGDFSSSSRFVRAVYLRQNTRIKEENGAPISPENITSARPLDNHRPSDSSNAQENISFFGNGRAKAHAASDPSAILASFHVLNCLSLPYGAVKAENGRPSYTQYISVCDPEMLNYYYTTYENMQPRCVPLTKERMEADRIIEISMLDEPTFIMK